MGPLTALGPEENTMKTALSLALTACLVASAVRATAQEVPRRTSSLTDSVRREALRLLAAPPVALARSADGQNVTRGKSKWSRVSDLEPGSEITLTVKDSPAGQRRFVAAEDSLLTVLNLTDGTMDAATSRLMIDAASDHPEYFLPAQRGQTFRLNKTAQLTPEGIFVDGRKVAAREQVVMQIAPDDVEEISVVRRPVTKGVLWGIVAGGVIGFVKGLDVCRDSNCYPANSLAGAGLIGGVGVGIGSGVGAAVGATFKQRNIVYRAPAAAGASSVPPAAR